MEPAHIYVTITLLWGSRAWSSRCMVEAECIMLVSFSFHFFLFFKRKFNMLLPFCFYIPILLFFLKYVFVLLLFSSMVMFYPLIEDVLFLTIFSEKSHSTMLFMFFFSYFQIGILNSPLEAWFHVTGSDITFLLP